MLRLQTLSVHRHLLNKVGFNKGDRVIVNVGNQALPDYRVGKVVKRRKGKTGLIVRLDRGDVIQRAVTETGSGIVGKCSSKEVPSNLESIPLSQLAEFLDQESWIASDLKKLLEGNNGQVFPTNISEKATSEPALSKVVATAKERLQSSESDIPLTTQGAISTSLRKAKIRRGSRLVLNVGAYKRNTTDIRIGKVLQLNYDTNMAKVKLDVVKRGTFYKKRYPIEWWDVNDQGEGILGFLKPDKVKLTYNAFPDRISPADLDDWLDKNSWFALDLTDPELSGPTLLEFQRKAKDSTTRKPEPKQAPKKSKQRNKDPKRDDLKKGLYRPVLAPSEVPDIIDTNKVGKDEIKVVRELMNLGVEVDDIRIYYATDNADFSIRIRHENQFYAISLSPIDNLWYIEVSKQNRDYKAWSEDELETEDAIINIRKILL